MTVYTNKQFEEKTEEAFAKIRKQMASKIEAIQEYYGGCIDFHVFQPAVENAYMCEPEQFDTDMIEPESLQTVLCGAESIIDELYYDIEQPAQQPVQQASEQPVQQAQIEQLLKLIKDYKATDSGTTLEAIADLVDSDYELLCPIMASHGITY